MKRAAILLLLFAVGCSSSGDFYSLNKSSYEYIKETYRQSRELRKENWKNIDFKRIHEDNKHLRKTSRAFTKDAFLGDEKDRAREGWETLKWMFEWDAGEARKSIRFGHLDTGE